MKVKQNREDFVVEEVVDLELVDEGPYSVYALEKAGIGTLEALRVLERSWRLQRRDLDFAGLKDKHGITAQTITVRRGPRKDFEGRGFKVRHVGFSTQPADRSVLRGNRFRIVLRDLAPAQATAVVERARAAGRHGFPDYYDDQRFGSMRGTDGGIVARALLRGDPEQALKLAIASPSPDDRGRLRQRRRLLQERWGYWRELVKKLEPSFERKVCDHLAQGVSFQDAYALLDRDIRSLHLAAYQAWIFNACLRRAVPAGPSHPGVAGPYVFYEADPGALSDERIPLAAQRAESHPLLDAVLAEEGFDRERLGTLPFRRGIRDAVAHPGDLEVGRPETDTSNRGRKAVTLAFTLGPGSYATMLLKRCTYDVAPRGRARRKHRG